MSKIKKTISALMIASTLGLGVSTPQPAQAGIILTPLVVGIVLLVYGIKYNDVLWIVLDADGNLPQDALAQNLSAKYPFIDDREVVNNLAIAIREKAATTPVVDGKKNVTLNRAEVLYILAPTGLAELQPQAVEQMIQELQ